MPLEHHAHFLEDIMTSTDVVRAWREGHDAYDFGRSLSANPYPEETSYTWGTTHSQHLAWIEGWKAGDRDAQPATE